MIEAKHVRLLKLEKSNKKKLTAVLLFLLLKGKAPKTQLQLMLKVPLVTRKVQAAILDLHTPAHELANADSLEEDQEPAEVTLEPVRAKQVATAAKALVAAIAALASTSDEPEFSDALEAAVGEVESRIGRIATTETFGAYAEQVLANTAGTPGEWQWDAILDKRTCPHCDALHGLSWSKQGDVPTCPAHARCRCIIEFYPSA